MDYIFCVRNRKGDNFGNEPGATHFLEIPKNVTKPTAKHKIRKSDWVKKIQAQAATGLRNGVQSGDILFYVHGFNTSQEVMVERHRKIRDGLVANGFGGVVVSFDWPSADSALNYLEDRSDAKRTALKFVDDGIKTFAALQRPDCHINLHILAHSMGCYVVREAFDDADDRPAIAAKSWSVSQVMLVSGDVSASSLRDGSSKSSSLYRHCVRLTNYYNPFDDVLSLSSVKRVGVAPRAGRVGLPSGAPSKAVNVYCGGYFKKNRASFPSGLVVGHIWYFDDSKFLEDVFHTVRGEMDRHEFPTRAKTDKGNVALIG
jgi:esterase/lipase superfamily enzyme